MQLEVGSVATDFEHRSFGQELAFMSRGIISGFHIKEFLMVVEYI